MTRKPRPRKTSSISRRVAVTRCVRPGAILVGAERDGLPPEVLAACDEVAHIPIASESLNAAMAATVALYECNRRMAAP